MHAEDVPTSEALSRGRREGGSDKTLSNRRGRLRERVARLFFFQAEGGIRDYKVTGVQTCALPICVLRAHHAAVEERQSRHAHHQHQRGGGQHPRHVALVGRWRGFGGLRRGLGFVLLQIGRASCRERGEISGVAGSLKKKKEG